MRGTVQIDSVVAMGVFLVFVAWSFNFYLLQFQEQTEPLKELADTIQEKVTDYLEIEVYTVPVAFNSPGSAPNTVLYMPLFWPYNTKNSSKIKQAGTALGCEISGDYIYWQDDLSAGNNYYTLEIANTSVVMNCTSSLDKSIINHTRLLSQEKKRLISQSRIDSMAAMNYSAFSQTLGVSGADFRVEIQNTTGTTSFGKTVPKNRNVYVPVSSSMIWESSENINITVSVW